MGTARQVHEGFLQKLPKDLVDGNAVRVVVGEHLIGVINLPGRRDIECPREIVQQMAVKLCISEKQAVNVAKCSINSEKLLGLLTP